MRVPGAKRESNGPLEPTTTVAPIVQSHTSFSNVRLARTYIFSLALLYFLRGNEPSKFQRSSGKFPNVLVVQFTFGPPCRSYVITTLASTFTADSNNDAFFILSRLFDCKAEANKLRNRRCSLRRNTEETLSGNDIKSRNSRGGWR